MPMEHILSNNRKQSPMNEFPFQPHEVVPFRDQEAIERVRRIRREDITRHANPDFRIHVVRDSEIGLITLIDRFYRLKTAMDEGREVAFILAHLLQFGRWRKVKILC